MKCENFLCDNYCESKTNNCKRYSGFVFDHCSARNNFHKLVEEKLASTNTVSPKLPEWKEIRNALPPAPADWGCEEETSVEIFEYGAQSAYDLIVQQLRAGA